MRIRVLAGVILILFVWVPLSFYWYFFNQRISTILISSPETPIFSIRLEWTLSSSWLPLADKFLVYEQECYRSCQFWPIPPIHYGLTMTSTGYVDVQEDISLATGEKKEISLALHKDVKIIDSTGSFLVDIRLWDSLVENANKNLWGGFSLVGINERNRVYALRKSENTYQIGMLSTEKFIPFRNLPPWVISAKLDETKNYFVFSFSDGNSLSVSVTMDDEVEAPLIPDSVVKLVNGTWKFRTNTWVYILQNKSLQLNPRFSDFLDISDTERIWYIWSYDTERLKLSNFPESQSILIFLNRKTGESYVLKRNIDIKALFFYEWKPAYVDSFWRVWYVDYKK